MRLRFPAVALMLAALALPSRAADADSTAFRFSSIAAPVVLCGTGLGIHFFAHDSWDLSVKEWSQDIRGGKAVPKVDDWAQYVPLALDLGLGALGAEAEHRFTERFIEAAIAYGSCGILSWSCKLGSDTLRPNGLNRHSFPSGHTTFVFTGAELVRMEYGPGWGAGAYAIATGVAAMRIYRNWHWLSDVLAGAGVGILSARIGGWLLKPAESAISRVFPGAEISLRPSVDGVSGAVVPAVALRF